VPLVTKHYCMSKKIYLIILAQCCISSLIYAQQKLVFSFPTTGQTVEFTEGNKISILYKGYLGQVEYASDIIRDLNDTTLTLMMRTGLGKPKMRIIRIADIIAFRRISLGRQLAKLGVSIAGIASSYYLVRYIYRSSLHPAAQFGLSLSSGIAVFSLNNHILPDFPNCFLEDGWVLKK
jgi:hypothetical protein